MKKTIKACIFTLIVLFFTTQSTFLYADNEYRQKIESVLPDDFVFDISNEGCSNGQCVNAKWDRNEKILTIDGEGTIAIDRWVELARKFDETAFLGKFDETNMNESKKRQGWKNAKFDIVIKKDVKLPSLPIVEYSDHQYNETIKYGFFENFAGEITIEDIDTSNLCSTAYMFHNAKKANPDVSNWDVSKVYDMTAMFKNAKMANPNVLNWDVSNVRHMEGLFAHTSEANPDVSNWNVSKVVSFRNMFKNAKKANPNVSSWNVAAATSMFMMFANNPVANPDVSNWDVSNVENMYSMFKGTEAANPDVSNWDVSKVTDMSDMFARSRAANPVVSQWNTSNVELMSYMFAGSKVANPDVSNWDVSSVKNMMSMFEGAKKADPDVANWNVGSVENMSSMFAYSKNANPDVSKWNVSNVEDMSGMFKNTKMANPDVSNWNMSNVRDVSRMFEDAKNANPDISKWTLQNADSIAGLFRGTNITTLTITKENFPNAMYMVSIFDNMSSLEQLEFTLPDSVRISDSFSGNAVVYEVKNGNKNLFAVLRVGDTAEFMPNTHYVIVVDEELYSNHKPKELEVQWIFKDVSSEMFGAYEIKQLADSGYLDGFQDGKYYPEEGATRATVAATLYKIAGKPTDYSKMNYKDVTESWMIAPVSWVTDKGVMKGYNDEEFAPNDVISQQQFCWILYKFDKVKNGYILDEENKNLEMYVSESGEKDAIYIGYSFLTEIDKMLGDIKTFSQKIGLYELVDKRLASQLDDYFANLNDLKNLLFFRGIEDIDEVANYAKAPVVWSVDNNIVEVLFGSIYPNMVLCRIDLAREIYAYLEYVGN